MASGRLMIPRMCEAGYATVPRGFLSLPMLLRCSNLGIARAAPPCTSGSASDRTRVNGMPFSPDVSTPNTIGDISPDSAEQSANIRRGTPRLKVSQIHRRHIGDTSATHRRHIGDTSATHRRRSCKHRRCTFAVIISPMFWGSVADPSPMVPNCSAKHWQCYGEC